MLVNLEYPSNLFPSVETTPLPARTGHNWTATYKRSPMLQMIRPTRPGSTFRPGVVRLGRPCTIAIAFCVLIAITIPAAPKQNISAIAEIRSVLWAQQEAWNRGDIDGFMNGYARSKSTIFISEDTVRRGWEAVRDRYRKKYSDRTKMGVLTFSDLEIRPLSPDSAVAFGRWKLQLAKDRSHGRFTLIFRRLSEGWRIVHDHTSAAPPPRR
jgi:ketosteroid isomerase-like protein